MLALNTILHPTDFSEQSEHAFHLACSLARDHGARLIALHAWIPSTNMLLGAEVVNPDAEDNYREAHAQLTKHRSPEPDVPVTQLLLEGDAATTILQVAQESSVDLIVMGTHGRRGLKRLLMGSVAERVMREASCPVVTVRQPIPELESHPQYADERMLDAPLQEMVIG